MLENFEKYTKIGLKIVIRTVPQNEFAKINSVLLVRKQFKKKHAGALHDKINLNNKIQEKYEYCLYLQKKKKAGTISNPLH